MIMQNQIPPHLVKLNPPTLIKLHDKFLQKSQQQQEKDEVDSNIGKNNNNLYFQRKRLKTRPSSISSTLCQTMPQSVSSPLIKSSSIHIQLKKQVGDLDELKSQQNILQQGRQLKNVSEQQSILQERQKINQFSNCNLLYIKKSASAQFQRDKKKGDLQMFCSEKKILNSIDEESDQFTDYELESEKYLLHQKKQNSVNQNQEENFKYQVFDDIQKKQFLDYIKNQDLQNLEKLFKDRMESILKSYNQQIASFQESQQQYKKQTIKILQLEQQISFKNRLIKEQKFKIDNLQNQLYQERQSSQLFRSCSHSTLSLNKVQSAEFSRSRDNLEIQNI